MRTQLLLLSLAAAILATHGAQIPEGRKLPAIWSRLLKIETREERAAAVSDVFSGRSLLDDQLVALIQKVATAPGANPLNIAHLNVNVSADFAHLQGSLDQVVVTGLSGLLVQTMKINPLLFKADFSFLLPELQLTGDYDVTGLLASLLPIYGKGPFTIWAQNLKVAGTINLATNLSIKNLALDLGLEAFHLNFDMLLGDADLSVVINEMLNDLAPAFLARYEASIELYVGELVKNRYNAWLAGRSVADVMALVGTQAECKP